MRVHFHTDCYCFGGSEINLLTHLGAAAHSPDIDMMFTYRSSPEYESDLRSRLPDGVTAEPLGVLDPAAVKDRVTRRLPPRLGRLVRGGIGLLGLKQFCLLWNVRRLSVELRRSRPDVLHINNGGFPGASSCNAAAIAARMRRVPAVVYVANNLAVPYRRPGRWMDYPVDRIVAGSVGMFVTASVPAGKALRTVLRLPGSRQVVIPNAAVPDGSAAPAAETRRALGIPDGTRVILVMARLEARKGHRYLLEAVARMPDRLLGDTVLLVVGDGPEREALGRQADTLGIGEKVHFLGARSDRWSLYEASDVIVLPSVANEDMPIVILDAMAAGRPVVATRIAGIPEQVVDGHTGVLVDPGDVDGLASALAEVLADDEVRTSMGTAARERYRDLFTPERFVGSYRSLYTSLLARRRGVEPTPAAAVRSRTHG